MACTDASPRTLLLSDGGLMGLIAAACLSEEWRRGGGEGPAWLIGQACWDEPGRDGSLAEEAKPRRKAVDLHAELFSLERVELDGLGSGGGGAERLSRLLLAAGYAAARQGCRRVVWPVQIGEEDLEALAETLDRALLASRLVTLDAGRFGLPEVRIETPYADLSDEQAADLAADLSVPMEACWWSQEHGEGARAEQERWGSVLEGVGA